MNDAGSSELVIIARAVKPRGLKGELVAELLTDFPERFEDVEELVLVSPTGERTVGRLEDYWFQNDRVVLKLATIFAFGFAHGFAPKVHQGTKGKEFLLCFFVAEILFGTPSFLASRAFSRKEDARRKKLRCRSVLKTRGKETGDDFCYQNTSDYQPLRTFELVNDRVVVLYLVSFR